MAVEARLQLSDGSNTYVFDLGGAVVPEQAYSYRRVAGLVELESIEERWVVTGAAILALTTTSTWAALDTFLAHLEDRTTSPLNRALLQRSDGAGGWVTVRTLGNGNNQQEFVVDGLDWGGPDPRLGSNVQRLALPISMTISAVRPFEDSNGITKWSQRVSVTAGQDGLQVVEWQTEIEVAAGATPTALTAAQTHAIIPIANYGNRYVWDTNSANGFDLEYPEADEANSLTPTRILCTSRIRQKGITIGTPTPGASVGDLTRAVETVIDGLRTTTITRVTALGPGALGQVQSRAPSGPLAYSRELDASSERIAEGEWHKITQEVVRWRIEAVLSGGHQDVTLDETAGNLPPEELRGVFRAMRLELRVTVEAMGRDPKPVEMQFPGRLGAPWIISLNESGENTIPRRTEIGTAREYDVWQRELTLVYLTPTATVEAYNALIGLTGESIPAVTSYLLPTVEVL